MSKFVSSRVPAAWLAASTAQDGGKDGSVTVRESWAQSAGARVIHRMLWAPVNKICLKNGDDVWRFFLPAVTLFLRTMSAAKASTLNR